MEYVRCVWLGAAWVERVDERIGFNVVGRGLVSTVPAFVRSSASHAAGPHDRLAQKR